MEYLLGIIIALVGILMVMCLRLVTTFFHEMGHAIPALMFTKKDVTVYVGSYGDVSKSMYLVFGRLKMYLKANIFEWQIGLCTSQGAKKIWQRVLITLGGPIASVLIAIPLFYFMTFLDKDGIPFFACMVFIIAAVIDLIVNLFPMSQALELHDGGTVYNDGMALLALLQESRQPDEYHEIAALFKEKQYEKVVELCDQLIDENPKNRYPYDFMVEALSRAGQYDRILQVFAFQKNYLEFDEEDYFILGKAFKKNDQPEEAMQAFEKYYFKNYLNPELINEMSEVELTLGNPKKALERIIPAIKNHPDKYKSYVTLARAYMSLEQLDLARKAIGEAEKLKQDDAMLYYYKGKIYEKTNQNMIAINALEKAKSLGCELPGLDFVLESLRY